MRVMTSLLSEAFSESLSLTDKGPFEESRISIHKLKMLVSF